MTQILGTMRSLDETRGAVRVEDLYDTTITDLWGAISEPDRLARWIATVDGTPGLGDTVRASFTSTWEGPIRVEVCDAPNRLVVKLDPDTDDETVVEATLMAEGERTRLVIEERGLPIEHLYAHGAGWQAHIEDLARSLSGGESTWKSRWHELSPTYRELAIG